MPATFLKTSQTIRRRVIRWTAIATALGSLGGWIFGTGFGALVVLTCGNTWRVMPIAGYFALCGAAAGALLGVFGAIVDGDDAPTAAESPPPDWEADASLQTIPATPQKFYRLSRWGGAQLRR